MIDVSMIYFLSVGIILIIGGQIFLCRMLFYAKKVKENSDISWYEAYVNQLKILTMKNVPDDAKVWVEKYKKNFINFFIFSFMLMFVHIIIWNFIVSKVVKDTFLYNPIHICDLTDVC